MNNTSVALSAIPVDSAFCELKNSPKLLKNLLHNDNEQIISKTIYRKDGITVDKIIEINVTSGETIKITNYNYFDDKKIKSVEDYENGIKVRDTSYNIFKVITEFDRTSGKKFRTYNYNLKMQEKLISIYDYDMETEKIVKMTVFQPDGETISFVKEISPQTGMVTRCINYKKNSKAISSVSQYKLMGDTCIRTTYYYRTPLYLFAMSELENKIIADDLNNRVLNNPNKNVAKLIDSLYKNSNKKIFLKIS